MPRVLQQPAYVLHARAYRENSLLLETLTREHGRAAMVARGAKGAKSKWRNLLQPFRPLLVSWSGRGELGTLTGADQVAAPPRLHGEALYCGLYLNELLIRLLHRGDPHPEVFERYRAALSELAREVIPTAAATRIPGAHPVVEGLANVRALTADMNDFTTHEKFDRIVSVEMFEHMRNYRLLLERIARWLLLHPDQSVRQGELASAVGLGPGFVSRIVKQLEERELVVRDDAGAIKVRDAGVLLDAWHERYDFSRGPNSVLFGNGANLIGTATLTANLVSVDPHFVERDLAAAVARIAQFENALKV